MWIRVNTNLIGHPKVWQLAATLQLTRTQVVGILVGTWSYVAEYHPVGNVLGLSSGPFRAWLGESSVPAVGDSAELGESSERVSAELRESYDAVTAQLFDHMLAAGWLDQDDVGLYIHDWQHYNASLHGLAVKREAGVAPDSSGTVSAEIELQPNDDETTTVTTTEHPIRTDERTNEPTDPKRKASPSLSLAKRTAAVIGSDWHGISDRYAAAQTTKQQERAMVELVFGYWCYKMARRGDTLLDGKRERIILKALREAGGSGNILFYAIDGAYKDDWAMGTDPKSTKAFNDISQIFATRAKVEEFANARQGYTADRPHKMVTRIEETGGSDEPTTTA